MGFRCFLEGAARVFVRWSADFQSGGLAIKARCKLACKRDLRDYTQGRVGRPPRFRLTKKSHLQSTKFDLSNNRALVAENKA